MASSYEETTGIDTIPSPHKQPRQISESQAGGCIDDVHHTQLSEQPQLAVDGTSEQLFSEAKNAKLQEAGGTVKRSGWLFKSSSPSQEKTQDKQNAKLDEVAEVVKASGSLFKRSPPSQDKKDGQNNSKVDEAVEVVKATGKLFEGCPSSQDKKEAKREARRAREEERQKSQAEKRKAKEDKKSKKLQAALPPANQDDKKQIKKTQATAQPSSQDDTKQSKKSKNSNNTRDGSQPSNQQSSEPPTAVGDQQTEPCCPDCPEERFSARFDGPADKRDDKYARRAFKKESKSKSKEIPHLPGRNIEHTPHFHLALDPKQEKPCVLCETLQAHLLYENLSDAEPDFGSITLAGFTSLQFAGFPYSQVHRIGYELAKSTANGILKETKWGGPGYEVKFKGTPFRSGIYYKVEGFVRSMVDLMDKMGYSLHLANQASKSGTGNRTYYFRKKKSSDRSQGQFSRSPDIVLNAMDSDSEPQLKYTDQTGNVTLHATRAGKTTMKITFRDPDKLSLEGATPQIIEDVRQLVNERGISKGHGGCRWQGRIDTENDAYLKVKKCSWVGIPGSRAPGLFAVMQKDPKFRRVTGRLFMMDMMRLLERYGWKVYDTNDVNVYIQDQHGGGYWLHLSHTWHCAKL